MQVYKLTFPNGYVYIGSTSNVKRRWMGKGMYYKGQRIIGNKITQYGWDNVKREVLYETDNRKTAENVEYALISLYKHKAYNILGCVNDSRDGNTYDAIRFRYPHRLKSSLLNTIETLKEDSDLQLIAKKYDLSVGVILSLREDLLDSVYRKEVIRLLS